MLSRFRRRKGPQSGPAGPVFPRGQGSGRVRTPAPAESNLIIEAMEPRLLLSVSVSAHAVQLLHDDLTHFATLLSTAVETQQALSHALPGVAIGDTHNIGTLAGLSNTFTGTIVQPLAEVISATAPTDSTTLASTIQTQINHDFNNAAGNTVTVTDNSANGDLKLTFAVNTDQTTPFSLNFGAAGATYGIHLPQVSGSLESKLSFNFDVGITSSADISPASSAFSVTPHLTDATDSNSAFTVAVHATANVTGATVDLGLLTLTAGGTTAAPITLDVGATIGFGLTGSLTGTSIEAGTAPAVTTHVSLESGSGPGSVLFDLPLTLTADNTIPGIPAISATMHVLIDGQAGEGNFTVDVSSVKSAFAVAMGDPSFDISNFNRYSVADLVSTLQQVDNYLGHIAGVSALNITIPYTDLTIGGMLDLASKFQAEVINPLHSVAGIVGFAENQTNAVTLTGTTPDLTHLTALTTLHIVTQGDTVTLKHNQDVTLAIGKTYLNSQNVATGIQSVDDLVTSVNQAIAKTGLNGLVQAFDRGGDLSLSLVDTGHVLTTLQIAGVAASSALGFTSTVSANNTTSAKLLDGTAPQNLANLPVSTGLHITLDDGTAVHSINSNITIGSTYIDTNGHVAAIQTVDNLVTALNQALKSSSLYGYVVATNVSGHVELQLTDPATTRSSSDPQAKFNHAYSTITVTSPGGATVFSDLRSFGMQLADALGLQNTAAYGAAVTAADQATALLTGLGFGYDAASHEITWSISKEFDNLISANVPFSTSLDFGSVGGLAISNAILLVTSSVIANLTIGLDFSGIFTPSTNSAAVDIHAPSILDRLSFHNTGISATLDVSVVPTDLSHPITISGNLGPFSFTATPSVFYVSLTASLFLNNEAAADPTVVTFADLQNSLIDGNFGNYWTFNLASGRPGLPFAELDITNVHVFALGSEIHLPTPPTITVSMADPQDLLSALHVPHPHIDVQHFSANLSVADILSGIQTVFNLLDSSFAAEKLPLINLSIDDILTLAQNMVNALAAAQADPSAALNTIATDINHALGGDYLSLTIDPAATQIQVGLHYTPTAANVSLPFNLNLTDLATFLGSDGGALTDLVNQLGTVASLGASGSLQVTASATVALTFGINLQAPSTAAATSDKLSALNAGKGLRTDAAGQNDLQFTLANGTTFAVNIGALGAKATVSQLISTINAAANVANFAVYDAATGGISFTDTTSPATQGLSALGLSGIAAVDAGPHTTSTITASLPSNFDATKAYSFNVNIAGVITEVDLAADAGRTLASFGSALRAAISGTMVDAHAMANAGVNLPGSFSPTASGKPISLAELVSVVKSGNQLMFVIRDDALGQTSGHVNHVFALADIGSTAVAPSAVFTITSLNGSHIALDLGLGSDTATAGGASPRVISGKLEESASQSDRFMLETGVVNGVEQTGLTAHVGIVGTNLNFSVGIGPLTASIVGGTATFGKDLGKVSANNAGFHAGNGITDPAEFLVGLSDGTSKTSFGFSHLGSLHVTATANAAVNVNLPVQVFGTDAGAITLKINNLFGVNGPSGLATRAVVPSAALNLDNFSISSILNDPKTLIAGLDQFLGLLDGGLAQQIYGVDLPLVGHVLAPVGDFFSTLHSAVIGELNTLLSDFEADHPGQPVTTQNIVTQGLQYVLSNILHLPGTITSYIDDIAHPTVLAFFWKFDDTLVNTSVSVSSDLGIPGLGLNIAGATAKFTATLHVSLGFGYAAGAHGGFFVYDTGEFTNGAGSQAERITVTPNNTTGIATINFAAVHALDISIAVSLLTPQPIGFNLGFLRMMASVGLSGTTFKGDLFVDIGPAETTGMLFFREFSKTTVINAQIVAALNIDLMLSADLSTAVLPSVSAEFVFAYGYEKLFTKATDYQLTHDGGTHYNNGVTTPISLLNVQVDLGSFLTGFLKPIIDDIDKVISPIRPILDFLNKPIPGLSDLIPGLTLLDIADAAGVDTHSARAFITMIDDFDNLAQTIDSLPVGQHIMLDFGDFVFGSGGAASATHIGSGTVDPLGTGSLKSANIAGALSSVTTDPAANLNRLGSNLGGQLQTMRPSSYTDKSHTSTGGSFDLPFLHSPMAALQMLTGQIPTIDLVHWTLPTFDFTFTKDIHVTFLGIPHVAELGGDIIFSIGATIRLAFGYDTTGIIQFMSDHNPLDFFNGLYIDDTQGPQLILHASITGELGLDLVLVKAGIGVTLAAEVDFQFADFSHTGKVRLSTVIDELITDPLDIFVVHGTLTVDIFAYFWVGIDLFIGEITLYSGSYDIYNATIFSFGYDPTVSTPVSLATRDTSDPTVLTLDLGSHSNQQGTGTNTNNPNQNYEVSQESNGSVDVTANGITQNYTGVNKIVADLGDGNSSVKFDNGFTKDVTITGGDGNNVVSLGGVVGDPLINLGNGNNTITAAQADTTIVAGNGNNKIFASNSGKTIITAGSGNNVITGGTTASASDTISVGDGNNVIYGGSGSDVITAGNGGSGHNVIYGADGTNVIKVQGSGNNVIFGHGAHNASDTTTDTVSGTQISANSAPSTATGNSTISGGSGNDVIFGVSGNNSITGGAGHDVIFGATGVVTLDGHGGMIRAYDSAAGGGNNHITVGNGGDIVIGGAGSNVIIGGNGGDILIGGNGSVDGSAGGDGHGLYSISGTLGGASGTKITGGVGNDVIIGDAGATSLSGGAGNDIILGHDGIVIRDAAVSTVSAPAHLVSIQTTDEGTGGNVSISGGGGNDVIMAGAGSNTIDGGTGSDVIIGHYGTIDATSHGATLTVTGRDGATAGNGDDTITASQNAIIMGGGGNNTITTTDTINYGNPVLPAGVTDVNQALPPITPTDRTVVAFGANGTVNFDYAFRGGIVLHTAATVEDTIGGNNHITVGDGGDYVFGGIGSNTIVTGHQAVAGSPVGDAVILGHVGSVSVNGTTGIVTVVGDAPGAVSGNDTIDAYGNALIITGAGNNTVTTHDQLLSGQASQEWSETVLAGYAAATFSFASNAELLIHTATTTLTLENTSGFNRISVGGGDDIVMGGAGGASITAGNGNDIILGHLGAVNLDAMYAPDLSGATPDVISFTNGQDGTGLQIPGGPGPVASYIIAGNGRDIVMGGGGDNIITVGDGDAIVFGASGAVTRDNTQGLFNLRLATTTEDAVGGNNTITTGNGSDVVFGGAGANTITVGTATLGFDPVNDIVLGHAGHIVWADDHSSITVTGDQVIPSVFFNGNDIINAYQNTLVITGGGDNTVTTHENTTAIPSDRWTEIVIGGAATATLGMRSSGQFELISAQTIAFQEDFAGNNTITVGDGADVVIGGSGANTIAAGNGNDVILGHLGELHFDRLDHADATGAHPDVIGYGQPQDGSQLVFLGDIITAGNGSNIIVGGGGDNAITTGNGGSVIFGAGGAVTRDGLRGNVVIEAQTRDELFFGGDNTITTGDGDNVIFGGRGYNTISAGTGTNVRLGNDIIVGHAGKVQYSDDLQYVTVTGGPTGGTPDIPSISAFGDDVIDAYGSAIIIGGSGSDQITTHDHASALHALSEFTEIVLGDSGTVVAGHRSSGQFLLNVAAVTGPDAPFGGNDVISVGDSAAVVIDGAGANKIMTGSGSAVVADGYGVVAENPVTHTGLVVSILGSGFGFNSTITTGTEAGVVIDAPGYTVASPTGTGIPGGTSAEVVYFPAAGTVAHAPPVPGPMHLIAGSATLASGTGLSALAASLGGSNLIGTASAHPAPVITAYVLDTTTGLWIEDHSSTTVPLLSLVDHDYDLVLDMWGDLPREALPGLTIAA